MSTPVATVAIVPLADALGNLLATDNLRAQDTVAGSWTLYSNSFTPPSGAFTFKIGLGSELQSGWIAFDDLSIEGIEGGIESMGGVSDVIPPPDPDSTLYSTGFESGDSTWSSSSSSAFPATSIWNGSWGTGAPHAGSRAVVISNHAYPLPLRSGDLAAT